VAQEGCAQREASCSSAESGESAGGFGGGRELVVFDDVPVAQADDAPSPPSIRIRRHGASPTRLANSGLGARGECPVELRDPPATRPADQCGGNQNVILGGRDNRLVTLDLADARPCCGFGFERDCVRVGP
jgi:hypothetical protein